MTDRINHNKNGAISNPGLAGGEPVEVAGLFSGEQPFQAAPDADVGALVTALRDLVIRKPEQSKTAAGSRRQDLAEAVDDFIYVISLAGKIDYVNPAVAGFLGMAPDELLGRSYGDLGLLPDDRAEELLAQVVAEEEPVRYEMRVLLSGETRFLYATLSPMRDSDGCISGILGIAKDVSEIARAREELRSLSLVDELTGVYNRRGFVSLANQHLSLAKRNGSRVCLVMADMDGLKAINDRFGHSQGDSALAALAGILRSSCRQSDVVARIGGDEFVLLASGMKDGGAALLVARLREAVKAENSRRPYYFSASIGFVESTAENADSVESMLHEADQIMYMVKRRGTSS